MAYPPPELAQNRAFAQRPPVGRRPAQSGATQPPYRQGASPYSRDQARYRTPSPRRPTERRRRIIAGTCVAAIVLAGAIVAGATSCSGSFTQFSDGVHTVTSTPVSRWRAGEMPHLYQTDPAWASEPYAETTVEEAGCGPTCLSMVYVYLTGKTDLTPPQMAAFSERNGYVESGMTAWRLMTEGASLLGLRAEELPASEGIVAEALDAGQPVICSLGPGDFTTVGHFIVLCGRDENGNARVYDPNSAERSAQGWQLETILGQSLNLWGFSRG